MIKSISTIGALWPVCATCKHIAQDHDKAGCSVRGTGQCASCKHWNEDVKCFCMEYNGPTWEEFKQKYLTPEEIKYYHWEKVMTFKQYRRKAVAELRPYVNGEPLDGISIAEEDRKAGSPTVGDMIARNPNNYLDQWLVAEKYFKEKFEEIS